ncbi:MAG: type II toxin-antitoxin system HigB family toxin [Flavobacterium sp.]|nr:MAG: type II toxin-antitoxin system HigB family toxin [Flavobacterium sp.]
MKVHLIKKQSIEEYSVRHARSWTPFNNWITAVKFADWESPEDIKQTFGAADLLGNGTNRVVFDIGGNNYRMICKYAFGSKQVHLFICWIGSHREYDILCKKNEQYTINNY